MALPAQVEQDIKDIEALETELAAQNTPPAVDGLGDGGEETAPKDAPPPVEAVDPPPTPDKPVDVTPTPPAPAVDFEQKYNTLRGKYDAEVPRLHAQIRDLVTQMDELKAAVEAKPAVEPEQTYVTEADKKEFGADLLDVQRRVAMEVGAKYESKITKLETVIDNLTKRLDETGGKMTEMTFEQRLNRAVPDFDDLNNDARWIAWLNEVDPILRGPRRTAAQQAFANGDVEAVADYVRMFKQSITPATPATPSPKEVEMERQVTPSRTTPTTTPTATPSNAQVYSEAEMNASWEKVTTLNKAGRYDEANKLEAEISAALIEGRVR